MFERSASRAASADVTRSPAVSPRASAETAGSSDAASRVPSAASHSPAAAPPATSPASHPSTAQPAVGGWHPAEWGAEFAGTLFQLLAGFCLVAVFSSPRSALRIDGTAPRLLAIGACFGILAAIVAVSPLGKRSGAHLNPAVTLGFWLRGHVHRHDVAGYVVAQVLGAFCAAALFVTLLGGWVTTSATPSPSRRRASMRSPPSASRRGSPPRSCSSSSTSSRRRAPRGGRRPSSSACSPCSSGPGAPYTGASMNPARSLGPAAVSSTWQLLWVYFVGPPLGALIAAGLFRVVLPERRTLTAKLFHDERYPTTLRSELPAQAAGAGVRQRHPRR